VSKRTLSSIVIHCVGSPNGKPTSVSAIREDHIKNRGWGDIGYHFIIQPSGKVETGRHIDMHGAHCPEMNSTSIGVCLSGTDRFSREQLSSLASLVTQFQISKWNVFCHNQFRSAQKQGKTCPGMRINDVLEWLITGDWKPMEGYLL